jgi:hypothetical protein
MVASIFSGFATTLFFALAMIAVWRRTSPTANFNG